MPLFHTQRRGTGPFKIVQVYRYIMNGPCPVEKAVVKAVKVRKFRDTTGIKSYVYPPFSK